MAHAQDLQPQIAEGIAPVEPDPGREHIDMELGLLDPGAAEAAPVIFHPLLQLPGALGEPQAQPDRSIGMVPLIPQLQGHEAYEMVAEVQVQPVALLQAQGGELFLRIYGLPEEGMGRFVGPGEEIGALVHMLTS